MLKTRIITAAILIPIFVFLVLKLSPLAFGLFTGLFVLLGAWEWSRFMGLQKKSVRLVYVFFIFLLMKVSITLFIPYVLFGTFVWWMIGLFMVLSYPKRSYLWGNSKLIRGFMGVCILIPTWVAINFIRLSEGGPVVLLFLCVLIWGADSGAYFAGKKFGKRKLAPAVSPGKTWEGFAGALTTTVFIALGGYYTKILPYISLTQMMLLAFVTVVFSIVGDLFESMLKRNVGIKDSGQIFPGHGGLLDRIDSLTAAAPIFALGYLLIMMKNFL